MHGSSGEAALKLEQREHRKDSVSEEAREGMGPHHTAHRGPLQDFGFYPE